MHLIYLSQLASYAIGITNPWDKVAFIAVDPENLSSKYYSPDTFQDHGHDVIPPYDRGSIRHGRDMIPPPLANNNDEEEDDTNATSASTDIPASVIQFMKLQLHERTGIPSVVEDDEDADY